MAESGTEPVTKPGTRPPRSRLAWAVRTAQATRTPLMLDRFELVLLLVVITIAVQGLVDVSGSVVARLFANAISGLALLAAVRASGVRRQWRRAVDVLVVVVLVTSVTAVAVRWGSNESAVPPETTWLLAAALTPLLVARRLLQHQVVTLQTIMGAVAAYLQIAVAYAFLYQTVDAYSATNFFGKATPTTTYMYFSLVTISTVGYGDFVAVTSFGRMAAASEAVLGQVFLVTFVALIVSRFGAHLSLGRHANTDLDAADAEAPEQSDAEADGET
jgi:hypothetical protein